MNNKLQQLAALMRVTTAYVLGRSAKPTEEAPVDFASLSEEEQKRVAEIAAVSGRSVAELLLDENGNHPVIPPGTPPPAPPTGSPDNTSSDSAARAALRKYAAVVREALTDLEASLTASSPQPSPPNDSPPDSPADPDSPTDPNSPTHPDKDPDMPIVRPDFAHAHVRLAIDGDSITVEKATGIKKTSARFATDAPEGNCHADSASRTSNALVYANGSDQRPKNTRLIRMDLADDHKIDPSEVVVIVSAADRETAYRHDFDGFSVSDHSVDAVIRDPEPDTSRPKTQARFDVMLFRIG